MALQGHPGERLLELALLFHKPGGAQCFQELSDPDGHARPPPPHHHHTPPRVHAAVRVGTAPVEVALQDDDYGGAPRTEHMMMMMLMLMLLMLLMMIMVIMTSVENKIWCSPRAATLQFLITLPINSGVFRVRRGGRPRVPPRCME